MLNFYKIVKENLSFNRFEFKDTVCLEYTCPIDAEDVAIYSKSDYIVHVLSGKKTYKTATDEWTLEPGQTLYLKKGSELIQQYFDDEYCMLGFFISDDLIRETYNEVKGQSPLSAESTSIDFTGITIPPAQFLEGYFHSMLNYFRGIDRPSDQILVFKLKELLITLMSSDASLTTYFQSLTETDKPMIQDIMEKNFCFNHKLENFAELTHRSLSSFKREFKMHYNESPGKWLVKRRVNHAANLIVNSGLSITQIAFESGFEDLSHFSRVFKSQMGHSPAQYKKMAAAS